MIRPDLRKKVEDNIKPPSKKLRDFEDDQNVMVRNYMSGQKWVHGTILHKRVNMSYDVLVASKIWKRHTDQIVERGLTLDTPNKPEEIIPRPDPIPTVGMTPAPPAVTSDNQVKVPNRTSTKVLA